MSTAVPGLKLFGFHITDIIADAPIDSTNILAAAGIDTLKYECQYCLREFINSQALGDHQNAHKKEREKLKRANAADAANAATEAAMANHHNFFFSTFSSPPVSSAGWRNWLFFSQPSRRHFPASRDVAAQCGVSYHSRAMVGPKQSGGGKNLRGLDLHLSLALAGLLG